MKQIYKRQDSRKGKGTRGFYMIELASVPRCSNQFHHVSSCFIYHAIWYAWDSVMRADHICHSRTWRGAMSTPWATGTDSAGMFPGSAVNGWVVCSLMGGYRLNRGLPEHARTLGDTILLWWLVWHLSIFIKHPHLCFYKSGFLVPTCKLLLKIPIPIRMNFPFLVTSSFQPPHQLARLHWGTMLATFPVNVHEPGAAGFLRSCGG